MSVKQLKSWSMLYDQQIYIVGTDLRSSMSTTKVSDPSHKPCGMPPFSLSQCQQFLLAALGWLGKKLAILGQNSGCQNGHGKGDQ